MYTCICNSLYLKMDLRHKCSSLSVGRSMLCVHLISRSRHVVQEQVSGGHCTPFYSMWWFKGVNRADREEKLYVMTKLYNVCIFEYIWHENVTMIDTGISGTSFIYNKLGHMHAGNCMDWHLQMTVLDAMWQFICTVGEPIDFSLQVGLQGSHTSVITIRIAYIWIDLHHKSIMTMHASTRKNEYPVSTNGKPVDSPSMLQHLSTCMAAGHRF
jgi:hypothetical protein